MLMVANNEIDDEDDLESLSSDCSESTFSRASDFLQNDRVEIDEVGLHFKGLNENERERRLDRLENAGGNLSNLTTNEVTRTL